MNLDLAHEHNALGANWIEAGSAMIVSDYGNTAAAIRAAEQTVAILDRSYWGRLKFSGEDRLKLLHNNTTAPFEGATSGQVIEATVLTATARMVDLVTTLITEDAVLMITSPERREVLQEWFPRFIFFTDDVTIEDITDQTALFSLIGPQSNALLEAVVGDELPTSGTYTSNDIAGATVRVAHGSGLSTEGYSLLMPAEGAPAVFRTFQEAGTAFAMEPLGRDAWEQLRIKQGRPAADHEITEDHNPLEAGLWHAISFEKGCYIGQEIVARLETYDKVKQFLMRLTLERPAEIGAVLYDPELDKEVGRLSSVVETADGVFGLAYVRRKAAKVGRRLTVRTEDGDIVAELATAIFVQPRRTGDTD